MLRIEERPAVRYSDIGGCKEQIKELRQLSEFSLLHHSELAMLDIAPPKGVLLIGPPHTGKCLCARTLANGTGACFIKVTGTDLVQTCVGSLARMIRDLFKIARSKEACVIFFDEIDVIASARFGYGAGGCNEIQKAMFELLKQLDSSDPRGNIKVLMATNKPDSLDPALLHHTRIHHRVEFSLPDLESREHIFRIYASPMIKENNIRFELLARLCPNTSAIEIITMCTEAGKCGIRANRKATENHFLEGVHQVIKFYANVPRTPRYTIYNNQFHTI